MNDNQDNQCKKANFETLSFEDIIVELESAIAHEIKIINTRLENSFNEGAAYDLLGKLRVSYALLGKEFPKKLNYNTIENHYLKKDNSAFK
ncbi:hypothetical protein D6825_01875 [Candidatus Woesearchaeota archaeon]|nr:MAG: hypothetical protein D6825_01875 [Candidatus Woesearchaeota archaeon]